MTLQQLRDRLALYLGAEERILGGAQESEIDGERFRFADLADLQTEIRRLKNEISVREQVESGGGVLSVQQGVFVGRR